jgi:hypothetical protein
VTWSAGGTSGSIVAAGRFSAAAPGSATVSAAVTTPAGDLAGSAAITVVPDTIAPVPAAPVPSIVAKSVASPGAVSVSVAWAAASDVGTGVASYELEQRVGVGPWTPVPLATPLTRSATVTVAPGAAVEFHVRAIDNASNVSDFRSGGVFQVRLDSDRMVTFARTWYTRLKSSYLDGRMRSTRLSGATASYSFTGSGIAWIAPTGPTAGSARVEIDGKVVATVSLRSTVGAARKIVFSKSWTSIGRHKIVVRALATSGHPWVNVDGFAVIDVASPYPVLAGAGDIGVCGSTWDSATAALIDKTPGTIFAAGDLAYPAGTAAQFRDCYGTSWGYFKKRTMPVPGNHEYGTAGAKPYFAYFGPRVGKVGTGWYAYNVGTWRVYSLNANCGAVGGCGAGSPQERWLKADLAAHPTACIAAIWHQPLFSSGPHGNNSSTKAFWQDLYAAGAEIVINGHDHDYERFAPQTPDGTLDAATGIREFVVGTGGAGMYALTTARANSEVFKTGVHGIIKFTLLDGSYTWQFVPVAGSTWTDSGTATCH